MGDHVVGVSIMGGFVTIDHPTVKDGCLMYPIPKGTRDSFHVTNNNERIATYTFDDGSRIIANHATNTYQKI